MNILLVFINTKINISRR